MLPPDMHGFVDPRTAPQPSSPSRAPRTTSDPADVEELHLLCKQGRLYEVERWIAEGRPLQLAGETSHGRRRRTTLEIALRQQHQALVLLLLCNGYDLGLESSSPLDQALELRRSDLVELLLTWGADPHEVDREKLFDSYDTALFERFYALGVDLTRRHALAEALAYHTSNKPLFGFAKRHREHDAALQRELNMALAHHAYEGNEKGALLCLWAGADPHAPALSVKYSDYDDPEEDDEEPSGGSAVSGACFSGHVGLLERFQPDPARDDFERLFQWAHDAAVVDVLARHAMPVDVTGAVKQLIWSSSWPWTGQDSPGALRRLFELGMRWTEVTPEELREIRRLLLQTRDFAFDAIVWALGTGDYVAADIRRELARTSAFQKRMQARGLMPEKGDRGWARRRIAAEAKPLLAAFGLEAQPVTKKRTRC